MARFTNVDYNKIRYSDANPFQEHFKESFKEAKNLAIEAYDKKVNNYIDEYKIELEKRMIPPEGAADSLISSDGKINPAFYNMDEFTPEKIITHMKKNAVKYGLKSKISYSSANPPEISVRVIPKSSN